MQSYATVNIPQVMREKIQRVLSMDEAEGAEAIEKTFKKKVELAGRPAKSLFRIIEGEPNHVAAVVSRYADLVIAGQPNHSHDNLSRVDPGEVVAVSGRPVFVVPQNFRPKGCTEHAVLAWNGSREAGRALSDAAMILGAESRVTVVTFSNGDNLPEGYGFDICTHLNYRGIETQRYKVRPNPMYSDRGMDLVDFADTEGADLIIMGAYSSSRVRQRLFGGATHTVLKSMRTPVFLSH